MQVYKRLILINVVVFILQFVFHPAFTDVFALIPSRALSGAYWQFFTYMFLHDVSSFFHILVNMFMLYMFGRIAEKHLGSRKFLFLYLVSGLFSAVLHVSMTVFGIAPSAVMIGEGMRLSALDIPMLGASGAVLGILTAFVFLFPEAPLYIIPIPIPIKAKYLLVGYVAFSVLAGVTGLIPGIAHFGHLGGIITGAVFMYYWKRSERRDTISFEFVWE